MGTRKRLPPMRSIKLSSNIRIQLRERHSFVVSTLLSLPAPQLLPELPHQSRRIALSPKLRIAEDRSDAVANHLLHLAPSCRDEGSLSQALSRGEDRPSVGGEVVVD